MQRPFLQRPGLLRHSFRSASVRREKMAGWDEYRGKSFQLHRVCENCLSLTHTSLSIWSALHARRADAHEGTDKILTGHTLGVTVIQSLRALILVWYGIRDGKKVKYIKMKHKEKQLHCIASALKSICVLDVAPNYDDTGRCQCRYQGNKSETSNN